MIDIHSHLLPAIDDGPRNWDESLDLCRAMVDDGIQRAVATPHLIDGVYNNVRSRVEPLTRELNERCRDAGVALDVLPGGEVDIACRYVTISSDELPLLGGGPAVLLEMPVAVIPHSMAGIIFSTRSRGLLPVLAHPERNELVQDNLDLAREWITAGAALQIDGDSLLDVWGKRSRRCAEALLKRGLCHAIASDAHSCQKRPPRLDEAVRKATELIGEGRARDLVTKGPESILSGQQPPPPLYPIEGTHVSRSARKGARRRDSILRRLLRRD